MLVFALSHHLLKGFRLEMVVLRLVDGAHLHGSFDHLKWLKHCSTDEATDCSIDESGHSVALHYGPLNSRFPAATAFFYHQ